MHALEMAPPNVSGCLEEETLAALMQGDLRGSAQQQAASHIVHCASCRTALADAAYGIAGSPPTLPSDVPVDIPLPVEHLNEVEPAASSRPWPVLTAAAGDIIGNKYRVEGLLGRGGMGTVLLASHLELGHRVAIKVLHYGGQAAAARFLREAQLCAQLANEHVVRAFDLGQLPGGAPYLIMEYLDGEDLSKRLVRGVVPVAEAVRFTIEACRALSTAHAQGIVHRDLKPANLFLVRRPSGAPTVKVLDFGISKVLDDAGVSVALALTSTGTIVGSPLYMSPEQIRAMPNIDARTDIWSLGVILYELLTGRPPFVAASIPALAVAIATDRVTPPSALRPEVTHALDTIVQRCLAKSPVERIASVELLEQALLPLVQSLATAHPKRQTSQAPSRVRTAAGITIALLLAAGSAAIAIHMSGLQKEGPPATGVSLAPSHQLPITSPDVAMAALTASSSPRSPDEANATSPSPALMGSSLGLAKTATAGRRKGSARPATAPQASAGVSPATSGSATSTSSAKASSSGGALDPTASPD